jgi:hypothetical protein
MPLKCQVYYPIFSYVVFGFTFGVLVEVSSAHVSLFVFTLDCYVHCFIQRFLRWAKFQAE